MTSNTTWSNANATCEGTAENWQAFAGVYYSNYATSGLTTTAELSLSTFIRPTKITFETGSAGVYDASRPGVTARIYYDAHLVASYALNTQSTKNYQFSLDLPPQKTARIKVEIIGRAPYAPRLNKIRITAQQIA